MLDLDIVKKRVKLKKLKLQFLGERVALKGIASTEKDKEQQKLLAEEDKFLAELVDVLDRFIKWASQ